MGIPCGTRLALDYVVARLTEIFVSGKFWVLFSLLFGMGFVVMQTQAKLDGRPFEAIYLRRTGALLIFGLLHIALLWSGRYPAFLRTGCARSNVASADFGSCFKLDSARPCMLAPAFLFLLMGILMSFAPKEALEKMTEQSGMQVHSPAADVAKIYSNGSYLDTLSSSVDGISCICSHSSLSFSSVLSEFS